MSLPSESAPEKLAGKILAGLTETLPTNSIMCGTMKHFAQFMPTFDI